MNDHSTLTFYKLCRNCNLQGLIDTFGDLSNTSAIEMDYAYYIVYNQSRDKAPILDWLLELDPNIDFERVANDYTADEHLPNDALILACKFGQFDVVEWLFTKEPYLSSFKNRCNICYAFRLSCCNENIDITKSIFNKLADYIQTRLLILNQAYFNAAANQNTQTMQWLLEINPNINQSIYQDTDPDQQCQRPYLP